MPRPFERIARCSGYAQPRTCRLAAGRRVAARASLRGPSGRRTCIRIREATASGVVGTRASCLKTSGQWQRIGTTYNIRSGGKLVVSVVSTRASGKQRLDVDQLSLRRRPSVYWGAYMDGQDTYSHYYGGTWADAPWDSRTWKRFESNAGKRVSIVHWGMTPPWGLKNFPGYEDTFNLVRRAGELNAVSMSTGNVPLRDIANGQYDAPLRTWAKGAASWGHPFFLLLDVEMNGTWESYSPGRNGNTASDFIAMWRHFHNIVRDAGARNVTWVWCPNVDPRRRFTPYGRVYPGDSYVDWTCLDGYNKHGGESFSWLFGSSYRKLGNLAPRKPVMIGQFASSEERGGKAAWIRNALSRTLPRHFRRIKAVLWFNWRIHEEGIWKSWPIESSKSATAAFKGAIGSRRYVPGGYLGRFPRRSPIEAP